jgi:hypothetical protein
MGLRERKETAVATSESNERRKKEIKRLVVYYREEEDAENRVQKERLYTIFFTFRSRILKFVVRLGTEACRQSFSFREETFSVLVELLLYWGSLQW